VPVVMSLFVVVVDGGGGVVLCVYDQYFTTHSKNTQFHDLVHCSSVRDRIIWSSVPDLPKPGSARAMI
jgi:hypothetical protein